MIRDYGYMSHDSAFKCCRHTYNINRGYQPKAQILTAIGKIAWPEIYLSKPLPEPHATLCPHPNHDSNPCLHSCFEIVLMKYNSTNY